MATIFCPECYGEVEEGLKTCPLCGSSITLKAEVIKDTVNKEGVESVKDTSSDSDTYSVRILTPIKSKLLAIKVVREVTGTSLVTAKDIVESAEPVVNNVSKERAKEPSSSRS